MKSGTLWIIAGFAVGFAAAWYWLMTAPVIETLDARTARELISRSDCRKRGVMEESANSTPDGSWVVRLKTKPGEVGDECSAFCILRPDRQVDFRIRCFDPSPVE